LTRSEVITLALMSQGQCFESERAFYRYAQRHWRGAFPSLPARTQVNRRVRRHISALVACFGHLVEVLQAQHGPFEVLDGTAAPTRDAKRRGHGGLAGLTDIGWSNRLGWYEGLQVLIAVNPTGVITGFGFGAASAKDQPLAESFFAARPSPHPRLASVGAPAQGVYVADKGFEGQAAHRHGQHDSGAVVICPPERNARHPWPRPWRRWLAGIRQIVETPSTPACRIPSVSCASVRMPWRASRPAWPRRWRSTISASGSMSHLDGLGWPSPISWLGSIGELTPSVSEFAMGL
jgi:hypothetical protein